MKLEPGFQIRAASQSDKAQILELVNRVQPGIPWSSEYYDWQLFEGPAGDAEVRVIDCDGRLVSMYVGARKKLWVDGNVRSAYMVQDVLTDPAFRGKGFLNVLANDFFEHIKSEAAIGYTFPNKLSENSFRRSGWTELCVVPAIQRRLSDVDFTNKPMPRSMTEVVAFDDRAGTAWKNSGLRVGVKRDSDFLAWRYSRPDALYRRFVIDNGAGFAVLKHYNQGDYSVVHVCELVFPAGEEAMVRAVIYEILFLAHSTGAALVTAWVTIGNAMRRHFESMGFERDVSNDRFVFVTASPELHHLICDPTHWYFGQGDSDVY